MLTFVLILLHFDNVDFNAILVGVCWLKVLFLLQGLNRRLATYIMLIFQVSVCVREIETKAVISRLLGTIV